MVPVTVVSKRKIDISLYIMLVPALILVLIYAYGPLGGLIIAFKRYDIAKGNSCIGGQSIEFRLKILLDPVLIRLATDKHRLHDGNLLNAERCGSRT